MSVQKPSTFTRRTLYQRELPFITGGVAVPDPLVNDGGTGDATNPDKTRSQE